MDKHEYRFEARMSKVTYERFVSLAQRLDVNKTQLFIDAIIAYEKMLDDKESSTESIHNLEKKILSKLDLITALITKDKLEK